MALNIHLVDENKKIKRTIRITLFDALVALLYIVLSFAAVAALAWWASQHLVDYVF
jgi:hypothetical protein